MLKELIARLVRETDGQDLIEYALLATLIGLATTASVTAVGASLVPKFTDISTTLTTAS